MSLTSPRTFHVIYSSTISLSLSEAKSRYLTQVSGEVFEMSLPHASVVALHNLECTQLLVLLQIGLFEPGLSAPVYLVPTAPEV
jgi:hypothetical protein